MRKKFLASVGIAALLIASVPTAASAITHTIADVPGGVIAVDEDSINGNSVDRIFKIADTGTVTGVTVSVTFNSSENSFCDDSVDYERIYSDELALTLTSPGGLAVPLVLYDTYSTFDPEEVVPVVTVNFSDSGTAVVGTTNDGMPEDGTFIPSALLSAFNGAAANGDWTLTISDFDAGAAQCYFGATLNVVTDSPEPVTPPAKQPTPAVKVETAA